MKSMSVERLRELLSYDPETGVITRLVAPKRSPIEVGDAAGSPDSEGYLQIAVEGMRFKSHRIAWALMTGAWPTGVIDHIDGITGNNRWSNLRDVSRAMNAQNQKSANRRNQHGTMGVSPNGKRWLARITVDGESRAIGMFDSAQQAHDAYIDTKRRLHAGCTI